MLANMSKGMCLYRLVRGNVFALPLAGGGKASLHGQARCCWTTPSAATNKGRPQLFTSLQKLAGACMDALRCCEPRRGRESSEDGQCCGQSYEMAWACSAVDQVCPSLGTPFYSCDLFSTFSG